MLEIVDGFALIATGMLVGNELAVAAFVHPTLARLPDDAHLRGASGLAKLLGRVMPFWYALVVLVCFGDAFLRQHLYARWPRLVGSAAFLFALSVLFTVLVLVPINSRIAAWTDASNLQQWKADRRRWDGLHWARVALFLVGLCLLVGGILSPG